jgi:hypothetical protein
MKKLKQIFTLLIISFIIILASCKKSTENLTVSNPLEDSLATCFKFNNDLADSTGKNMAGVSSGPLSFVTDRKGNSNSAIYFDGSAKLVLSAIKIPHPNRVSMCYWIKPVANGSLQYYIMSSCGLGIAAAQAGNLFSGVVSTPNTNSANANIADNNWHYLATTYNGTDIKFYVDGLLAATTNQPGNITITTYDYVIGFFNNSYWKGSIDEFRMYQTVLTDSQVLQLSKL